MSESVPTSPRSRARLGYALFVGAIAAAAVATASESQARPQDAQGDAAKPWRKRTLNFIPHINSSLDIVHGKWLIERDLIRCEDQHFAPRIQIRYEPPVEYDFIIQFSQPTLRHPITAIMPNRYGGNFVWQVGLNDGNDYRFLARSGRGRDWHWKAPGILKVGTKHTTIVQVRRNSIRCLLDGRELLRRETDFRDLTNDGWHKMPNPRYLGVGCDDPTTFYKVRVTEVSGPGKVR